MRGALCAVMDCYSKDGYIAVIIHLAKRDTSAHQGITQGRAPAVDKRLDFTQGQTDYCQLEEPKQPPIKTQQLKAIRSYASVV